MSLTSMSSPVIVAGGETSAVDRGSILQGSLKRAYEETPGYCNIKHFDVFLPNGIPHCGSEENKEWLPAVAAIKVNGDTMLCAENQLISEFIHPPEITTLFKMNKHFEDVEVLDDCTVSDSRRKYLNNELESQCKMRGLDVATILPKIEKMNKFIFLDDSAFQTSVKNAITRSEARTIPQFTHHAAQTSYGTWPSVVMPIVSVTGSSYATLHKQVELKQLGMSHVRTGDSLSCQGIRLDDGGTMLFTAELGEYGRVGIYAKKLKPESRWKFLSHLKEHNEKEGTKSKCKTHTLSTYGYKYYILVSCGGPHVKAREYKDMICGLSHADLMEHGISTGSTLKDFAVSSYYSLYLKMVLENARRLAYAFAMSVGCGVVNFIPKSRPQGGKGNSCDYDSLEIHVGHQVHESSMVKRLKLLKLKEDANRLVNTNGEDKESVAEQLQKEGITINVAEQETKEYQKEKIGEWIWKKKVVPLDSTIGIPAMAKEKKNSRQFTHTLQLYMSEGQTFVLAHGHTFTFNEHPKLHGFVHTGIIPEPLTVVHQPIFKLNALQGYIKAKIGRGFQRKEAGGQPAYSIISSELLHVREASFKSVSFGDGETIWDIDKPQDRNMLSDRLNDRLLEIKRRTETNGDDPEVTNPTVIPHKDSSSAETSEEDSNDSSTSNSEEEGDVSTDDAIMAEIDEEINVLSRNVGTESVLNKAGDIYTKGSKESPFVLSKRYLTAATYHAPEGKSYSGNVLDSTCQPVIPRVTVDLQLEKLRSNVSLDDEKNLNILRFAFAQYVNSTIFTCYDIKQDLDSDGTMESLYDLASSHSEMTLVKAKKSVGVLIHRVLNNNIAHVYGATDTSLVTDSSPPIFNLSKVELDKNLRMVEYFPVCMLKSLGLPHVLADTQ